MAQTLVQPVGATEVASIDIVAQQAARLVLNDVHPGRDQLSHEAATFRTCQWVELERHHPDYVTTIAELGDVLYRGGTRLQADGTIAWLVKREMTWVRDRAVCQLLRGGPTILILVIIRLWHLSSLKKSIKLFA